MSLQRSFAGYRSTFKNSVYFDNVVTVDSNGTLRSSFRRTFIQKNPRKYSTPGSQLRISDGRSPSIFYGDNSGNENLMYTGKEYIKKYSVNGPIHKYSVIPSTHKLSTIASVHKSSVTFKNRMLYVKSDNFIRNIWEKCGNTPYDDACFGIHTVSGTVSRKITQSSTRDFSKFSQKGEI
uniref:Piso0_000657 protein n=1 Tax=Strongyloides stercoralis TaxID=6248 RepID=A0A0K0E619_STRER